MQRYKGKLITFEGIDGCGKTTAMQGAAEILKEKYKIFTFRDPGSTKVSEAIRNILLDPNSKMDVWTEYYLYVASRAELVKKIKPYLERGAIVFLDRFYDSTIAYQGFRNKIPLRVILEDIKRIGCPGPDLTLLYKLDPKIGIKRNLEDGKMSRIDRESLEKHKQVYKGYEWIAEKFKYRVRVIDASQIKEKVLQDTVRIIYDFLKSAGR